MNYHLTGAISTFFFLLTLGGLWAQIHIVRERKRAGREGRLGEGRATAILSLNQFTMTFIALFSYFAYGFCLERFNHSLVWPRLVALCLVLVILFEIATDRRGRALAVFGICMLAMLGGVGLLVRGVEVDVGGRLVSQMLVVVAALLVIQGYVNQVLLIRRSGRTGAVAIRMHQMFLARDIAMIAFALAMGVKAGWPLLVMNGISGCTKVAVLYHFRWARLSPKAEKRRRVAKHSAKVETEESEDGDERRQVV